MANMNFGVNLLPKANNTYSLGNSDYKWLINGMALASACQYDVDTSILSASSTNLPTTQAVTSYVTARFNNPTFTGYMSLGRLSGSTNGTDSVALGDHVTASGAYATAFGSYTVANHKAQFVLGEYNSPDASLASASARGNYVLVVGNGTADNARSDALTLDWNGNLRVKGSIYVGANADGSGGTQVSAPDLSSYVQKAELGGAGITSRTYSAKFGGEFSVTTATSASYISPYARASVTGQLDKGHMHRVTINGTTYILSTRLWFYRYSGGVKVYAYLGNLGLYVSDISGVPNGTDNVPFVIIADYDGSGSIDVLTSSTGTYTILVEQINDTTNALPLDFIYEDCYAPILTKTYDGVYNGTSFGVNELTSSKGTFAFGYANVISGDSGIAIGNRNTVSYNNGIALGALNQVSSNGFAIGTGNNLSGSGAVAIGDSLTANASSMVAIGHNNVPANKTFPNYATGTLYKKGDIVNGKWLSITPSMVWLCNQTHTSSGTYMSEDLDSGGASYWALCPSDGDTMFVIGNGSNVSSSNAMKVDLSGNAMFGGNVYVNCNADSSGGTMLYALPSGGIPSTDLASAIQTSLGLADTAYQKPSGGIPSTDLASGVIPDVSGKADKVTNATSGNFASLDSNGNLTDSGSKASDFLTSHQDISGKADKTDTVLLTTLSRGRTANSTVGDYSFVFGNNLQATRTCAFAIGSNNNSYGQNSFTSGLYNQAYGNQSFVIGSNNANHFYGDCSFVAGDHNEVIGKNGFVFGYYCEKDVPYPYWVSGTHYYVGDTVVYSNAIYICKTENTDTEFDSSKWTYASGYSYLEVVGNGSAQSRSNARILDAYGNEKLKGKLYILANSDSSGGKEVITLDSGRQSGTTVGNHSATIGYNNTASGSYSVGVGMQNSVTGAYAVGIGYVNTVSDTCAVAIGSQVTASGWGAVALGYETTASGLSSFACGSETTASGKYATALGRYTIAQNMSQLTFGEYNVADTSVNASDARGDFIEIVGNGTATDARSNARTLDWSGNEKLAGDLTLNAFGNNPISLLTCAVLKGCTWQDLKGS